MKNRITLTRRKFLAVLAANGVGCFAGNRSYPFSSCEGKSGGSFEIELPEVDESGESFSMFLALSKLVTARTYLDIDSAKKLHRVFLEEPSGKDRILSTYRQLLEILGGQAYCFPPYNPTVRTKLGETERWFASHILTTWYVGIYYHESRHSQRLIYRNALMFDALGQSYSIPFDEAAGFGHWALPPADKVKEG